LGEVKDQLSIFNQLGGNDPSKWAQKGKHALGSPAPNALWGGQ
jgi:hypothetical protein